MFEIFSPKTLSILLQLTLCSYQVYRAQSVNRDKLTLRQRCSSAISSYSASSSSSPQRSTFVRGCCADAPFALAFSAASCSSCRVCDFSLVHSRSLGAWLILRTPPCHNRCSTSTMILATRTFPAEILVNSKDWSRTVLSDSRMSICGRL